MGRHTYDDSVFYLPWSQWVEEKHAKKLAARARKKAAYEKGRPAREQAALNRKLEKMMRWG